MKMLDFFVNEVKLASQYKQTQEYPETEKQRKIYRSMCRIIIGQFYLFIKKLSLQTQLIRCSDDRYQVEKGVLLVCIKIMFKKLSRVKPLNNMR